MHRVRVDVGARRGALAATLVVDPKVFIDPLQNDTDLLLEWIPRPGGWAPMLGYRLTQSSIDRGRQFHDILLLGASAGLPALVDGRVRGRFGFELELTILRHGAGVETEVLSFASSRAIIDLLSVNSYLRLEYAGAL